MKFKQNIHTDMEEKKLICEFKKKIFIIICLSY